MNKHTSRSYVFYDYWMVPLIMLFILNSKVEENLRTLLSILQHGQARILIVCP